ncbi:MAG: hypothetical protein ACRDP8_23940, partial [Actinopolymorphaceae bacterium]
PRGGRVPELQDGILRGRERRSAVSEAGDAGDQYRLGMRRETFSHAGRRGPAVAGRATASYRHR